MFRGKPPTPGAGPGSVTPLQRESAKRFEQAVASAGPALMANPARKQAGARWIQGTTPVQAEPAAVNGGSPPEKQLCNPEEDGR